MSKPVPSAGSSVFAPAGFSAGPQDYTLCSDLAKLSLPVTYRDAYRVLAWVNSICLLFLLVGIIGLKSPKIYVKPLSEPVEPMAIVALPPEEAPKPQPEQIKEDEPAPSDAPVETPQVVTVVAAVDTPDITFAVPVEGVTLTTKAEYAPPPPPKVTAAPKPVQFDANAMAGGVYPEPAYPGYAIRNRLQGTVVLEFSVDASGAVTSVTVQKTSGFPSLDDAAMKVVKERWRFPAGAARSYYKPFTFELK